MKEKEQNAVLAVAGVTESASRSLHNTIRYVYAVAERDFYNINVKDLFKIALSDITAPDILSNLGVSADVKPETFYSAGFKRLANMIFYAFAVRIPFLRRTKSPLAKDTLLRGMFDACAGKGAENFDDTVYGDFKSMMRRAKSREPEPPFTAEWFRRWAYSDGGELASINNKNMFLLGCMDAMFPLFYAALSERLTEMITGDLL
ncbi:MAG: hypothetical protein LBI38_06735 [Oscillospiraceae bacterium]|jgi:hypothetical protein|nr:hypothetical protein [Oscillospiraceae bacterium]